MKRSLLQTGLLLSLCCGPVASAQAHFGMLIPDANIIDQDNRNTTLTLSFSHPFEGIGMDLAKPAKFTVTVGGQTSDLLATLTPTTVMDHKAWQAEYTFNRPGVYQFAMEPAPYWEPAEDVSIIHYTKTIIPAFGEDQGWDEPIGLPTEIVPLTRPFGNYSGNSFTGQVLLKGRPVPGAEVEVELYNQNGTLAAVSDYHVTQLVKADSQGIFTFTCPLGGWWGFAALSEADYTIKDPAGKDKGVELGAVLWIKMDEYKQKAR
jgi:cobalt/nickel transport protein